MLKPRTIPKTTSGKIARAWCKKAYLNNTLAILHCQTSTQKKTESSDIEREIEAYSVGDEGENHEKSSMEKEGQSPTATPNATSKTSQKALSQEEVRALTVQEIVSKVEKIIVQLSSQGPEPLHSIDPKVSLLSLGLDSMTMVQLKGVLENR